MSRRSSIDALPPAIREAVDAAVKRGATIDQIVDMLGDAGADVSRSAVGRYSKGFRELATRQREMQSVAKAFGAEFGGSDDMQSRMLTQLLTSVVTRTIMPIASGEVDDEDAPDALTISRLAKAVKDTVGASKIDIEREAKIRDEEAKRARAAAAEAADQEGRAAGASDETIERIKRRILGLAA